MSFLFSIIPTILVLGILIIIHEYGHFLACRLTGVKVEKFSIGFGPEIFHWQGRETRFVVSMLPLGGYVKPAGESTEDLTEQEPKEGDYLAAPVFSRIIIVVAGVIMNYFLAFALFVLIFMMGRPVPGTVIGGFVDGYPAAESGLLERDRVVEINGEPVENWGELTAALEKSPDGPVHLLLERTAEGDRLEMVDLHITPRVEEVKDPLGEAFKVKRLGITPHPEASQFERYGPVKSIQAAGETTAFLTVMTHKAIYYLITGKLSLKTISGPIGIIAMTGDAAQLGLPYLLQLTATLSVSLAVINLLPIPGLDGGHFIFLLFEAGRRKRVSLLVQERMTQVGVFLLMALMVFIIYNDLVNLNVFDKIKNMLGI